MLVKLLISQRRKKITKKAVYAFPRETDKNLWEGVSGLSIRGWPVQMYMGNPNPKFMTLGKDSTTCFSTRSNFLRNYPSSVDRGEAVTFLRPLFN